MTAFAAQWIWGIGLVAWLVIRWPHMRRARKQRIASHKRSAQERTLLGIAGIGLAVVPLVWIASGFPAFADRPFVPVIGWLGALLLAASLMMFHAVHRQLGRMWSVTLEIRDGHKLKTDGLYGWVRHPMYSSFFLWALSQALLIPNWIAGLAGLFGIGLLYVLRVGKEEAMLVEAFGDDYRAYMQSTKRILPGLL
ncbi:MAG: isoprenylcysteine carboxylmethyltransferase family protein [Notoacmeibacter sp.]|nr:isoprenylcysteine carboxylmethyltransferase family protein [Notoacmeibacter sp.]